MTSNYDRRSSFSASRSRGVPLNENLDDFSDLDQRPSARRGRRRTSDPRRASYRRRMRLLVVGLLALLLILVAYVVVVYSPMFEIERVNASPTEHVTSETISSLAAIPSGSTLFNIDEAGIAERLSADSWISSVKISRSLPHTLLINVQERSALAVVMLANGSDAWLIASDGYWLEPLDLEVSTAENGMPAPADQAYEQAINDGLVYISNVSALVSPVAGELCTDETIMGVITYLTEFSDELSSQIMTAKATSLESISVVLKNGIEVSLGSPTNIALKEEVTLGLLSQYAGQITYINVRVPSSPTYRAYDPNAAIEEETVTDEVAETPEGAEDVVEVWEDETEYPTEVYETDEGSEYDGGPEEVYEEVYEEPEPETTTIYIYPGTEEGYDGGNLDEGGYWSDNGYWVYMYHDAEGHWIHGYYDEDGNWVVLS